MFWAKLKGLLQAKVLRGAKLDNWKTRIFNTPVDTELQRTNLRAICLFIAVLCFLSILDSIYHYLVLQYTFPISNYLLDISAIVLVTCLLAYRLSLNYLFYSILIFYMGFDICLIVSFSFTTASPTFGLLLAIICTVLFVFQPLLSSIQLVIILLVMTLRFLAPTDDSLVSINASVWILSILLTGGSSYFFSATLRKTNDALRVKSQRLIEAETVLRTNVARDIHREILPLLISALTQLRNTTHTERTQENLILALNRARAIQISLRPISSATNLVASLRELIVIMDDLNSAKCSFTVWPNNQAEIAIEAMLPVTSKDAIYRAIQDALNNALIHSNATAIKLTIRLIKNMAPKVKNGVVEFSLSDNGIGFNATDLYRTEELRRTNHYGLFDMKERLDQIGANFDIESDSTGTTVTIALILPLLLKTETKNDQYL